MLIAECKTSRLKKMEQENDQEEQARKGVTNELRMKKTQHMTASKYLISSLRKL